MTEDKIFDVVIAGGGVMGASVAYHLMAADSALKVAVVERDPAYVHASSSLSLANVRIQFSLRENIEISRHTLRVFETFEKDMAVDGDGPRVMFRPEGNLFLVDEASHDIFRRAFELQGRLGCDVEWWDAPKMKERYPLYRPEGIVGATFGPGDGHFDAQAVLMGYRAKARSLGAGFVKDEITAVEHRDGRATGVRLASGSRLAAGCVVNCAGAWAADLAATAGVRIPVVPVKRQVFVVDTAVKPAGPLPLTILPSGLYFRTETGGLILVGKSMEEDPVGYNFSYDQQRFYDILWLELATFVPDFERLKLIRGWAGLYAVNTLDKNAILGPWPELDDFFLVNGFSGHGLQQAPAVGRYLSELILGKPPVLDLSIFSPRRILENRPIEEVGIV
jgi:glycine/D-amino acid oxidase-like deaminating enzyme